jgi:alkanesulfonate monooxygenase SsuD/methylene tetrahydromethanopterin reductase-like flavin-dependent oxidoreductase (luciferase family)
MHVGLGLTFQNLIEGQSDTEVYRNELALASRAEDCGFDSVWTPEHHFTDYMLTPNVVQFLSWVAARTKRLKLGTMVVVLPWHDPVRVAENFTLLDQLSEGRAIVGIGRGLGRVEFDAFRLEMAESRRRFTEYAEAILTAIETGVIDFEGELYKQPRTKIRPQPYASFRNRTFASAISPYSIDLMARMGVGLLIIAQKPWETVKSELEGYRRRFLELNGEEPPKPVMNVFVAVSEDGAEAQRMREVYLQRYARSTVEHYQFDRVEFAEIEGYEYYAKLAANIAKHGLEKFNSFLADLQIWGTPDQVVEKLLKAVEYLDVGALLTTLCYGGMAPAVARANYDLFVSKVLPALKAHDVGGDIGVRYGAESRSPRVLASNM